MKKGILILFYCLLLVYKVGAQSSVYHPFPDSNAVWNISSDQPCGLFFDVWYYSYSILITGDTLIHNISYHKLAVPVREITSSGGCGMSGTWYQPGYYGGGIRQNIFLKKVYFVPPNDSIEQLLYDFNMQVGDTLRGFLKPWTGLIDTVQSIDTILVGTEYRKRWLMDPCYGIYFIEGIGSTYGLIERSPGCITDQSDYSISCFRQNGIPLYPDTNITCNLITTLPEVNNSSVVSVYPNPFHSETWLMLPPSRNIKNTFFELFNAFGSLVQKTEINASATRIHQNGLPAGIYFYRLSGDAIFPSTGKLIIE